MLIDANLFWFGSILELGLLWLLLRLAGIIPATPKSEPPPVPRAEKLQTLQPSGQLEESLLNWECDRLENLFQESEPPETGEPQGDRQPIEPEIIAEMSRSIFQQLRGSLISDPSLSRIAELKSDLSLPQFTNLVVPLENLLHTFGYEPIGTALEQVSYDPQLHQADIPDLQPGELVYVRLIGYRQGDEILCPAQVSRSLPDCPPMQTDHPSGAGQNT